MKKVLIITYYWPPSGGAGVQRWLKFTKYLPAMGIEPYVLTVDPGYASYPQRDESLQNEIHPDVKVFHTQSFELYQLYSRFSKKKEIPYGGFANEAKPSFFQKASRFFRGNFLLPDPRKGWNKFAYRKAVELINTHRIDTVITTSPPHSTQLIGLKLKKNTGIRWIADLRDPWTDIYYYNQFYHTRLAKWFDRKMEKQVVEKADQLITVSKDVMRLFAQKTKTNIQDKTHIIPNGYDEDDFKNISILPDEIFTVTYAGTISEAYDISGFIQALKHLEPKVKTNLVLRFVGKVPASIVTVLRTEIPEIKLDLVGYVDHRKSIEYLMRSSMLLLVIPKVENNKGILTGKFFEYLAARKPILAIGPVDGDLAEIISETGCGELFDYSEEQKIRLFIENICSASVGLECKNEKFYSRQNLTQLLVDDIINV